MKTFTNIVTVLIAIILTIIIFFYAGFEIFTAIHPSSFGCHILGMNGIAHIPANCIKYFIK